MNDETDAVAEPEMLDDSAEPRAWSVGAVVVAVLFAALHGWFLYQAITNLVYTPAAYENYGLADRIPWVLLIAGVALPVLLYATALWVGLWRELSTRVLLFAASLGATAATWFALYVLAAWLVAIG